MTRVPFLEFKDLDFTGDDLTGVSGVGLGYISWEGLKDHLQDLAGMLKEEREKSAKLQADLDAVAMDLGQAEQDKAALSSSLQEARDEEKTWMLACNLSIQEKLQAIGERDEAMALAAGAYEAAAESIDTAGDSAVTQALGTQLCCSGQMCGCQGADVGSYLLHLVRSLTPADATDAFERAVEARVQAALAAQGEPVAWRYRCAEKLTAWTDPTFNRRSPYARIGMEEQALYTHPAPAPAGVTVKQAAQVLLACNGADLDEWTGGLWPDDDATEALEALAALSQPAPISGPGCPETWEGSDAFPGGTA